MEKEHLTYRGGPMGARMLVSMLEAEGFTVEGLPDTIEQRHLSIPEIVTIELAVLLGYDLSKAAGRSALRSVVERFRSRWPKAEVKWREKDGYR